MTRELKFDHNLINKYIIEGRCTKEIYQLTGAPRGLVFYLFKKLGKKPLIIKPDEEEIILLHKEGKSTVEISKILMIDISRVHFVLKKNNLSTPKRGENKRRYHYNINSFEKIDTEEKAYWLGFLYADGYVSEKYRTVILTLANKDLDHLKKFRNFLGDCNPISEVVKKSPFSDKILIHNRLSISSCKMTKDLVKVGCMQAKTFKITFPSDEQVPKELIHHFIRGYFDGDGSVYVSKEKHHRSGKIEDILHCRITSTLSLVTGILQATNIGNSKCIVKKENVFDYQIKRKLRCRQMYDYLYKNATVFMERKKEIFDQYFK